MKLEEIELASRRAWPALEEINTENGILRSAEGVSRRANSMSPALGSALDASQLIAECEHYYASKGLASIVRVIAPDSFLSSSGYLLDSELSLRGYQKQSPTLTLLKTLAGEPCSPGSAGEVVAGHEWLRAFYQASDLPLEDFHLRLQLLKAIQDPVCYLLIRNQNGYSATAMAVRSGDMLGIYGVATARSYRRQGLAHELLNTLMVWGQSQGARYAYLHVEALNRAALHLYQQLGFYQAYSYWYRVKTPGAELPEQSSRQETRA